MSLNSITSAAEASKNRSKPLVLAMLGGDAPLSQEFMRVSKQDKIIVSNSSDRAVRAMSRVLSYGNWKEPSTVDRSSDLPKQSLGSHVGVQSEWRGKEVLRSIGIETPAGQLATTVPEALEIAARIGYPIALKVQASELAHKTEVGGVMLNLADSSAVERGWNELHESVAKHAPLIKLEGILVEKMARPGIEMVIGARRDRLWGPVLVLGLGGIYIELFKDTRIVAPDASVDEIVYELDSLKAGKLLNGFRGRPAVDKRAVAAAASALGRLLLADSAIDEIEINPLIVHADGEGASALDALLITR
jgi:acyl-CoA synthetase (NDP forming)